MTSKQYTRVLPEAPKTIIDWSDINNDVLELAAAIRELILAAERHVWDSPKLMAAVLSSINKLQSLPVWIQSTIREHLLKIVESTLVTSEISSLAAVKATKNQIGIAANDERFKLSA